MGLFKMLFGTVLLFLTAAILVDQIHKLQCRRLATANVVQLALLKKVDKAGPQVSLPLKASLSCHFWIKEEKKGYRIYGLSNLKKIWVTFPGNL